MLSAAVQPPARCARQNTSVRPVRKQKKYATQVPHRRLSVARKSHVSAWRFRGAKSQLLRSRHFCQGGIIIIIPLLLLPLFFGLLLLLFFLLLILLPLLLLLLLFLLLLLLFLLLLLVLLLLLLLFLYVIKI